MAYLYRLGSALVTLGLLVGLAVAADQTILGRQELVKDPTLGLDATKRKLVGQGKESLSSNTVVGDPTVGGATITFFAFGTTQSTQTFPLPQGRAR